MLDRARSHAGFVVFIMRVPYSTNVAAFQIVDKRLEPIGRVYVTEEEYEALKNRARGPELLWDIKRLCS